MDTKFAKTAANIIVGIEEGLNQFTAIFIGVFKIKILPNAAQHDPIIHHYGWSYSMNVLSHTPIMTNMDPMVHPIRLPNLSRTQLAGKAAIGWKMANMRALAVTISFVKWNCYSTVELMLEKVWTGSELTSAAKT
jgi:hypothetical protein